MQGNLRKRPLEQAIFKSDPESSYVPAIVIGFVIYFSIHFVPIGIPVLIMGLLENDTPAVITGSVFIGIGLLEIIVISSIIYYMRNRYPLILFQDGFYSGIVTPGIIFSGDVPITPFSEIERVEVGQDKQNSYRDHKKLILHLKNKKKRFLSGNKKVLEAIYLLNEKVPEKLDVSVKEYILDDKTFQYHPNKTNDYWFSTSMAGWGNFHIFLALVFWIGTFAFSLMAFQGTIGFISSLVLGGLGFLLSWYYIDAFKSKMRSRVMTLASPSEEGTLKIKRTAFDLLFTKKKVEFQLKEILAIKHSLIPRTLTDNAQIQLANGLWYPTNFEIFRWLVVDKRWKRNGAVASNKDARLDPDYTLPSLSFTKCAIWWLISAVLYISSSYFIYRGYWIVGVIIIVTIVVFFSFVVMIILEIQFIVFLLKSVGRNNGVIFYPGNLKIIPFQGTARVIPAMDVRSVEEQGRFFKKTVLRTNRGTFTFSPYYYLTMKNFLRRSKAKKKKVRSEPKSKLKEQVGRKAKRDDLFRATLPHTYSKPKEPTVPPPPRVGFGKVWAYLGPSYFEKSNKKSKIISNIVGGFLVLVGIGFFIPVFFSTDLGLNIFLIGVSMMMILFGSVVGLMIFFTSRFRKTYTFYESGFMVHGSGKHTEKFHPYGSFKAMEWTADGLGRGYYGFRSKTTGVFTELIPVFGKTLNSLKGDITKRLGNENYLTFHTSEPWDKKLYTSGPVKGKGKELFREPDDIIIKKINKTRLTGFLLTLIPLVVLFVPFFLMLVLNATVEIWAVFCTIGFIPLVIIPIGIALFVSSFKIRPLIFYENGVMATVTFSSKYKLIPYGGFHYATYGRDKYGKYYEFHIHTNTEPVQVRMYEHYVDSEESFKTIFSKINNDNYLSV